MPPFEPFTHVQQTTLGYCLPACGQMALAQLGITVTQAELAHALGTRAGVGTPFSRVERLARWGVRVQLKRCISVDELAAALAAGVAVIAALTTTPGLPGWGNIRTQHTVSVISIGNEQITYHDPALSYGPVSTLLAEFLLAWSEMDEQAAFLGRLERT
jgi:ABC-type bacteriocin/lantibiotic exporter with double-glycine peptidase domain